MTQPTPTTPTTPKAPAAGEETEATDKGGIVELVDEALSGIDLSPQQKDQLQKLGTDVSEHVGDVDKAKRDFLMDLAKEIESGRVDESSLKADQEKVEKAAEAASPDLRAAFQKLHDLLNADQRKEFVKNFRDALSKREPQLEPKAQIEEWSKTLSLSDDQKQKIAGILEEDKGANDETRARLDKVLDAFASDSFNIDQVEPAGSVKDRADKMMHRMIDQARKITDILTPEQRTMAAKAIRDKASERQEKPEGPTGKATAKDSIGPETTASQSEAWWAGRAAGGFGRGFGWGVGGAYGFSRGYATGFGGAWMF